MSTTAQIKARADASIERVTIFTEFMAEMDLIVCVTACSAPKSNNGGFKPIDVEILL